MLLWFIYQFGKKLIKVNQEYGKSVLLKGMYISIDVLKGKLAKVPENIHLYDPFNFIPYKVKFTEE